MRVAEERTQVTYRREQFSSSNDASNGLSVHWVCGKQERGNKSACVERGVRRRGRRRRFITGCRTLAQQKAADPTPKQTNRDVQQQVDKMVTEWLQSMQQVVEAECQHRQGPIGLVRLLLAHWRAPEIVEEYITQRRARSQILVVPYCANVIKYQTTLCTVVITNNAGNTNT